MTTIKTRLFLFLPILLISSCDPAKLLIINAGDKENTSITVYTNSAILPLDNKEGPAKMIIRVTYNDTTKKRFNYGIGNWPNSAITELTANIDSIIFKNNNSKTVLSDKAEMEKYLQQHRHGYAGSILTIGSK